LKSSTVIIAAVSLILVGLILDAILLVAFIPLDSGLTSDLLALIISFLVASLVVGYVFALKIQEESRIKAVGVIVVLSAFALLMFYSIWIASGFAYYWFQGFLSSIFNKSVDTMTPYELNAYSALLVSLVVIISSVIDFIGLYAGSMLRRPPAKTIE
jgi:hypothetical protein